MQKKRIKKTAPKSHPYRKRMAKRAFFSLILILGMLYIRENNPEATAWLRTQLHVSMDLSAAEQFMEKTLSYLR